MVVGRLKSSPHGGRALTVSRHTETAKHHACAVVLLPQYLSDIAIHILALGFHASSNINYAKLSAVPMFCSSMPKLQKGAPSRNKPSVVTDQPTLDPIAHPGISLHYQG